MTSFCMDVITGILGYLFVSLGIKLNPSEDRADGNSKNFLSSIGACERLTFFLALLS